MLCRHFGRGSVDSLLKVMGAAGTVQLDNVVEFCGEQLWKQICPENVWQVLGADEQIPRIVVKKCKQVNFKSRFLLSHLCREIEIIVNNRR